MPQVRVKYAMPGNFVVVVGISIASHDLMRAHRDLHRCRRCRLAARCLSASPHGLMQIAMQMVKSDAEFCIAHLHRICIKICIGSRAGAMKRKSARVCIDFDADTMQNTMQIERCRFPTFSSLFCIG